MRANDHRFNLAPRFFFLFLPLSSLLSALRFCIFCSSDLIDHELRFFSFLNEIEREKEPRFFIDEEVASPEPMYTCVNLRRTLSQSVRPSANWTLEVLLSPLKSKFQGYARSLVYYPCPTNDAFVITHENPLMTFPAASSAVPNV